MALISAEVRSKIIVVLIISVCVALSVLLGFVIFELPWRDPKSGNRSKSEVGVSGLNETDSLVKFVPLQTPYEKAIQLLEEFPVIDGHNDLPWNLRKLAHNNLSGFNFTGDLTSVEPWASHNESFTDIPRLRRGYVGGQFWVAYTSCDSQYVDSVTQTLEQIDVIHRLVEEYPEDLQFCSTADDILAAVKQRKIASLVGVEGGHSIQYSAAILRVLYRLGVRYLTLTHNCNTPWADASLVDAKTSPLKSDNNGVSPFGLEVVHEMNRLGMMVDLSHVSEEVMKTVLAKSRAPVIFSHSGAKAICDHPRNVGDDVLRLLKANGGIIMVNFYTKFIQCDPTKNATLSDVVDHLEHLRGVVGADHIGLGGDYDGVDSMPQGLEDVSKYPFLFTSLIERDWTVPELRKVSFENIVRVMRGVEEVRVQLRKEKPMETLLESEELQSKAVPTGCLSKNSLYQLGIRNLTGRDESNSSLSTTTTPKYNISEKSAGPISLNVAVKS